MKKLIGIEEKLKKCREAVKSLFGNDFHKKIEPHQHLIKAVMKANNIDVLPALMDILTKSSASFSAEMQIMFMAAAVEMIDPTT